MIAQNRIAQNRTDFSNAMVILAGLLFGLAIIGLGYLTRQGRAIPFYSTVLVVIALVYVLFAVMAGAREILLVESAIAAGFVTLAVAGARWPRRRWAGGLIAAGLVLHGGFDLVHDALLHNPVVPSWWPVFCAVVDVVVGADFAYAPERTVSGQGKTAVFVLINGELEGAIALADVIRDESRDAIAALKGMGLQVMMLTGDNRQVAA